jgi:hypothetical protein
MSRDMTTFNPAGDLPAELASIFDASSMAGDLTDNVSAGGFAVLSIRGSKWRLKHGGEERPILNDDGDPKPSIEVVILKGSKSSSKVFYEKAYEEGDNAEPTCMSTNGLTPDGGTNKQHTSCAACPHNQWGSRITSSGKKAKRCSDSRRLAVVPAEDIPNEEFDGPMLLRVPATSLNDLKAFGSAMEKKGYPYRAIVTRIGFDPDSSYPKLTFKAARPITNAERDEVVFHFTENLEKMSQILEEPMEMTEATPAGASSPAVDTGFDEEAPAAEKPKPAKKKAAAKKANPKPEPEPAADSLDADLDSIISDLDNLD